MGSGVLPLAMTTRSAKQRTENRRQRTEFFLSLGSSSDLWDSSMEVAVLCKPLRSWIDSENLFSVLCSLSSGSLSSDPFFAACDGDYKIKPMERLVLVSSTHCCASTSSLST